MQVASDSSAALMVITGKKPSGGSLLYVGALMVASGVVSITGISPVEQDLAATGLGLLLGAPLVAYGSRLMFQTVQVLPDRLIWKRFPSEVSIPYADIRTFTITTVMKWHESFDVVRIVMNDGRELSISHLSDGNDLMRALNTYGVRRG